MNKRATTVKPKALPILAMLRRKSFAKVLWLGLLAAVVLILWKFPQWQANSYRTRLNIEGLEPKDHLKVEEDLIAAESNARTTLAQIIGGAAILFGLYFTSKNIKLGQENLRITEEGKLTERFGKAIELLGNDKLDIRLGGIYGLERIARDSQKDHWTVMEVLTAFIREKSTATGLPNSGVMTDSSPNPAESQQAIPTPKPVEADIQAAVAVIGRRKWTEQEGERKRLDLSGAWLEKAELLGANLSKADLSGAKLGGADLRATNLSAAYLTGADLREADLSESNLMEANLIGTNLSGANLSLANISNANLISAGLAGATLGAANLRGVRLGVANLSAAHLSSADLTSANLHGARLDGADLRRADLSNADLTSANLSGANLESARHLSWDQLSVAHITSSTVLPPEFKQRWNENLGNQTRAESSALAPERFKQ